MNKFNHDPLRASIALTAVILGGTACNGLSPAHDGSNRSIEAPTIETSPQPVITTSPEAIPTSSPTPSIEESGTPLPSISPTPLEIAPTTLPGLVRDGCGTVTIDTGYAGQDLRTALETIGYDPSKMDGVRDTANDATQKLEHMHHKYQFLIPGDTFGVCIDGNHVSLDDNADSFSVIDK